MSDDLRRPIPVAYNGTGRIFSSEDEQAVLEVLRSGTLTRWGGTKTDALEEAWCAKLGVGYAVAVSSGTAALHVALVALDFEPGSEVITSPVSDMGTVSAIVGAGLVPVFADVDRTTGMITPESVTERLSPRTCGILPVHLFGRFAPVVKILAVAEAHGLALVEDASQAHFTRLDGVAAGTVGDLGCFSLQQTKVVSCGEGGMVVTDDDRLAYRARLFQNKGWIRGASGDRSYPFLGLNYRMPELSAAVAGTQLRRADEIIARRAHSMGILLKSTRHQPGLRTPDVPAGESVSWWALSAQYPDLGLDSVRLIADRLTAAGLPFTLGYIGSTPLYMMEALQQKRGQGRHRFPWSLHTPEVRYRVGDCPGAEWFLQHTVTMNWNEVIADDEARVIAESLVLQARSFSR